MRRVVAAVLLIRNCSTNSNAYTTSICAQGSGRINAESLDSVLLLLWFGTAGTATAAATAGAATALLLRTVRLRQ